jgi:tRNA threonylcarbamoyladenosine biosynthesis protein TsaB
MAGNVRIGVGDTNEPRLLIIESSSQAGEVALAAGEHLLEVFYLAEPRRYARDLALGVRELLWEQKWQARDLDGVLVSHGPGSYTGLRVGIMSAKALAYATGCALLAIDTFAAIARQAPDEALTIHVLADAQQDKIYVQSFRRAAVGAEPMALGPLAIEPVDDLLPRLPTGAWVSGPGLRKYEGRMPVDVSLVKVSRREAKSWSLLELGLARYRRGERDDLWTVEPLYLRPSSAEEQWDRKG